MSRYRPGPASPLSVVGWLLTFGLALALFVRYLYDRDGWRSFALFLLLAILIELRVELTKRQR